MNTAKVVLLAVMVALLIGLLIDGTQRAKQLQAVHTALQQGVRMAPGQAPVATMAGTVAVPTGESEDPKQRDGKPRPGVNFLLPYNRSHFHPEWVRGTSKEFQTLPVSLNPLTSNLASAGSARGLINESLCDQHPLTPSLWSENLARSVRILDDYKLFVFTIRPGVLWQRPNLPDQAKYAWLAKDVELTAEDFVFALDMINNPEVKCGHLKQYYANVKGFALDRHTLLLRWSAKEYTNIAVSLGLTPLPRHVYANNADGTPIPEHLLGVSMNKHWFDDEHQLIGVGRYRLEKFVPDQSISFVRDQSFWGAGLHFERIEWDDTVKDDAAKLTAFKNGQVHFHGLRPDQFKAEILDHTEPRFAAVDPANPKAGRNGELGWERHFSNSFSGLAWNCARPRLKDRLVRQALAHAFPKQRILQDVFYGLGRPQVGPVHPDSPAFNRELVDIPYDLERATALLAQAGWSDTDGDGWVDREIDGKRVPLKLEVIYFVHSRTWTSMLSIYRDALKQVGVDLLAHGVDANEWERRSDERDFDGFIIGWNAGDLEEDFKQVWHSSSIADQGSNYASWSNPEADVLIEQHRNEFDYDRRIELAKRFQKLCFEDQPYLFVLSGEGVFVWQNKPAASKGGEALQGVEYGFDHFHPLYGTSRLYWHLTPP